jgi:hypothetical protein
MLISVKLTLTAKLKLLHNPEQKAVLDATSLAYRDGLNYASEVAFAHGKTSNQNRVQKLTYPTLRQRGIPAQMACNIARTVGASYKVCGFRGHADLIAARNIALRTLLIWQDWMSTGRLSAAPDVRGVYPNADASDAEAKAERLKRYSELRWSPEASLHHTASAVGGGG